MISHHRYLALLAALFAVLWIVLAIAPLHRADWALENVLVLLGVIAIALSWRHITLSRVSYTLIFLFLCLHEVGAHYTYSEVPYDAWFATLTDHSFNDLMGWQRNQFDRLVHFLYGLLLAYPLREIYLRVADARGFWGYFLPLDVTVASSAMYEMVEWLAAVMFGGELGVAYLGTQGDVWDAQKDMLMAGLGAALAMSITATINIRFQRDFAREWQESLRVKIPTPLGEDEAERMLRDKPGGGA
jgi:putative membrane protein